MVPPTLNSGHPDLHFGICPLEPCFVPFAVLNLDLCLFNPDLRQRILSHKNQIKVKRIFNLESFPVLMSHRKRGRLVLVLIRGINDSLKMTQQIEVTPESSFIVSTRIKKTHQEISKSSPWQPIYKNYTGPSNILRDSHKLFVYNYNERTHHHVFKIQPTSKKGSTAQKAGSPGLRDPARSVDS